MEKEISILKQLVNATRPFKPFSIEAGDEKFDLLSRRLSAAETAVINQVYNDEYNSALEILEKADSSDLSNMRRTFERQKKDRLIEYIQQAERSEYLSTASSELDDLPFDSPIVINRANEIQEDVKSLYKGAPDEEIVDKALEKRAYVYAAVKASEKRNVQILYFSIYKETDEGNELAFESPEEILQSLDSNTIGELLTALATTIGEQKTDPLKLVSPKPSKKRTTSAKASEAELATS